MALPIFQTPGANALQLSTDVRNTMEELKKNFPDGVDYSVVYDPTVFVRHSIEAVMHTLLEAILLVVIVVIVFLQTWRASIIPLAAVPVSLVGTFRVMLALGFRINNLSLFGLVLAIGIVVDDAIVVVENVERNIALGLSPVDAAKRAMSEVTSPIIATALVLCAVFVPTAFISGLTGPVLQAVRHHHCDLHGDFGVQFADAFAGACAPCCSRTTTRRKIGLPRFMETCAGLVFPAVQPDFCVGGRANIPPGSARFCARAPSRWLFMAGWCVLTGLEFQQGAHRLRADAGQTISGGLCAIAGRLVARPHGSGHPPHVGHRPETAGRANRRWHFPD